MEKKTTNKKKLIDFPEDMEMWLGSGAAHEGLSLQRYIEKVLSEEVERVKKRLSKKLAS